MVNTIADANQKQPEIVSNEEYAAEKILLVWGEMRDQMFLDAFVYGVPVVRNLDKQESGNDRIRTTPAA